MFADLRGTEADVAGTPLKFMLVGDAAFFKFL